MTTIRASSPNFNIHKSQNNFSNTVANRIGTIIGRALLNSFVNGARGSEPSVTVQTGKPSSCLPPPSTDQSNAPAGVGLTTGGKSAFGENAIITAGGYAIVPEGKDMAWSVYAPGQKPGETPNTRIWGDPHVHEKDGTKWDFTRNSNFKLPDGTNISVGTSSKANGSEAFTVSATLDITNGADRVQVSGIDENKPVVGKVTHDGYQARANVAKQDSFTLGGDQDNVKWFKSDGGRNLGEVTGASMVKQADGTSAYEQDVKAGDYAVDPSLQPKKGTEAWGNMLRSSIVDAARNKYGSGSIGADLTAFAAKVDHAVNTEDGQKVVNFMKQLQSVLWLFKFMDVGQSRRNPNSVSAF